jgi:FKBP-type peptidyl-prolyl cis-trans isomerase
MLMIALCILVRDGPPHYVNVTADGKVRKRILEYGTVPQMPVDGQVVGIRYVGNLTNGMTFDSSQSTQTGVLKFAIGMRVIPGWNLALKTMELGERAIIEIGHEYGYGAPGVPPIVPSSADVIYEITLVAID